MAKTGPKPKDLTGQRFGAWTVLRLDSIRRRGRRWWCRCDCGEERSVFGFSLVKGESKSCGSQRDLTGQVFGKWAVLRLDRVSLNRNRYWLCRCECGTERAVFGGNLKNGKSASCGCTIGPATRKRHTTHGMTDSKPYLVWTQMLQRCGNPRHKAFHSYGGRGIKVCERWQDFALFWKDMGSTYKKGVTIERLDNNGNYEPDNCRWITKSDQSKNRRPSSEWRRSNGKISSSSR